MTSEVFEIETRQKADRLFTRMTPLGASEAWTSDVWEVDGYGAINFLAVGDQSFTLLVEEAVSEDGPWVQTFTKASSVDPSGSGNMLICEQVPPCANFMRVTIRNGGAPQAIFNLSGLGLPVSGSAGGGSGPGGTESLEQARQEGDTFEGDVFWDNSFKAVFGKASGEANQDYLQIYSDKAGGAQVIDSQADGAGTVQKISVRIAGVEVLGVDALGVTVTGKLTVTGAIDPTSVSLSGGTALYFDSAQGATAAVAPAGHGRIRYNDTTKTWQQSVDGGAYVDIAAGAANPWVAGGNAFGATRSFGTTDANDVDVIWNSVLVYKLRHEVGPNGQDMYYFRATRNDNSSQDCLVLENLSNGANASSIFQFYNDAAGAGMVTLCSSTYNTANGSGRGPDVYAIIGHDRVSVCSVTDDIAFFLANNLICQVSDGAVVGGIQGGTLEFERTQGGSVQPILLRNTQAASARTEIEMDANVVQGLVGVTSSGHGTGLGLTASTAYLAGINGSVTIATNGADHIRFSTSATLAMYVDGTNQGVVVGNPTGGSTGGGSMNLEFGVYKNGVAYANPKWALQHHYTGKADREGRYAAPKEYRGLMTLEEHEAIVREKHDLPLMLLNPKGDLFDRGDLLLASVEEAYLYIYQLHRRISDLEAKLSAA